MTMKNNLYVVRIIELKKTWIYFASDWKTVGDRKGSQWKLGTRKAAAQLVWRGSYGMNELILVNYFSKVSQLNSKISAPAANFECEYFEKKLVENRDFEIQT